jgi:hypothetical protein
MTTSPPTPGGRTTDGDEPPMATVHHRTGWSRRSVAVTVAALLVATTAGGAGGAGASGLLTGKNIRNDSLRSIDFRNGSINATRIRDGSLTPADVAFDLAGPRGPRGGDGPRGFPGIRSITLRTGAQVSRTTAGTLFLQASCNPGEIALSGGVQLDSLEPGIYPTITYSKRSTGSDSARTWETRIDTPDGLKAYTPWVICAGIS